jgi:hypothetical protein
MAGNGREGQTAAVLRLGHGRRGAYLTAGWMAVAAGVVILALRRARPAEATGLAAPA